MTVIAYKHGVLACDSGVFNGDYVFKTREKLIRFGDGSYFAASGRWSVILAVAGWLNGGGEKPEAEKEGEFGALWLRPDGLYRMDHDFRSYLDDAPFAAEGAHSEFVCGALAAGAGAAEAVELACKWGTFGRLPVLCASL